MIPAKICSASALNMRCIDRDIGTRGDFIGWNIAINKGDHNVDLPSTGEGDGDGNFSGITSAFLL